ncbi:beta-galactosidase [Paenibacillus nasutitermitis]|uniref:Glycoside hydrolase 35 catalytic domain-containing protein n=1 Tax=Paenibacillus nasutitermitis TaxID=1652958 RepID=A0A917E0S1_9BACL|nr:beta-galactosidase [Paenibacillus nasutitermitis]GGD85720.1 hypothetical protein GCM10010911_50180 [Paenibacillus nasutitermitis]
MDVSINKLPTVSMSGHALHLNGSPEILLCASLFYFRIPKAHWGERMQQLKSIGYRSIDVYFPWNHHELTEGCWDFEGEKDAAFFLKLAAEAGLWVVARPGPYICSEWDGGGLPGYLLADTTLKLRDNDPTYLKAVERWFDRILPILAPFQADRGGTIIGVQLENELDFYGCQDPAGYIGSLRDMARGHGITVPLLACAGQGGLWEASGFADDVVVTCNFYPNDLDAHFEEKVLHYREQLEARGMPLLVTETNRSHFLLRRLLSAGTKLLGPYLQVSGTDFGFTNATNNWGSPLAFLTSDYDFGGMISPEGHLREEAYEGRMLARLLAAYGPSLGGAKAQGRRGVLEAGDGLDPEGLIGPFSLRLAEGGELLFLANAGSSEADVAVRLEDTALHGKTRLAAAGGSAILPYEVPLAHWQLPGRLAFSTAELYWAQHGGNTTVLSFHAEGESHILLELPETAVVRVPEAAVTREGSITVLVFPPPGEDTLHGEVGFDDGRTLKLLLSGRRSALDMESLDERCEPILRQHSATRSGPKETNHDAAAAENVAGGQPQAWTRSMISGTEAPAHTERISSDRALVLEEAGIYRGYAWYGAAVELPPGRAVKGWLLRKGSDVVSLYADGRYLGTSVPGGSSRYLEETDPASVAAAQRMAARVEIWGHTNFHDPRLPALRLLSLKGIAGIATIWGRYDLSGNWAIRLKNEASPATAGSGDRPIVDFGGWLSDEELQLHEFRRSFKAAADANSWTLHFQGFEAYARVLVNGREAGEIRSIDPYVDISAFVTPGGETELTLRLERFQGAPVGQVFLYEGTEAADWSLAGAGEQELARQASELRSQGASTSAWEQLPLTLDSGTVAWLFGEIGLSAEGRGYRVHVQGNGLKLTVLLNDRIVGRLWLPGGEERPVMTGGSPDSFYLPGPWMAEKGCCLSVMLEAVDSGAPGQLDAFTFLPV